MGLTLTQQQSLAIIPKFAGLASFLFSCMIVYTVSRDQKKRDKTYHRLLLGMALADMSSSIWLAMSTWPIPKETGILWAVGNTTTCTFQGFFTQFGISSAIYNGSLSFYYLLVVRYGWRSDQMKRIEPCLHGVPLLWALLTAIAGLPLTLFNSANFWCWVASYHNRGRHADIFRWAFFYGPLWLTELVVTINLILVVSHVRRITKNSENHVFGINNTNNNNNHRQQYHGNIDTETGMSTEDMDGSSNLRDSVDQQRDVLAAINATDEDGAKSSRGSFFRTSVTQLRNSLTVGVRNQNTEFAKRRRQVAHQCFRYALAFYVTWIPISVRNLYVYIYSSICPCYILIVVRSSCFVLCCGLFFFSCWIGCSNHSNSTWSCPLSVIGIGSNVYTLSRIAQLFSVFVSDIQQTSRKTKKGTTIQGKEAG